MDNLITRPARESTIAKIAAALAAGKDPDKLPEAAMVPRPTWHRWKAKAANAPGDKATRHALKAPGARSTVRKAKKAIVEVLAASCATQPKAIDLMGRMTHTLDLIDELEKAARNDDGTLKDFEILTEAIKLNLSSLSTLARVTETLISGKRITETTNAIMAAIGRASPEVRADLAQSLASIAARHGTLGPGERSH